MGWARRNFIAPLPRFVSFGAFYEYLERRCRERQGDVLCGHRESIGERLKLDLEAMAALPAAPFDACHQASGQVSSQSLVRYRNNDYSVPVAYGYRRVWIRGYVDRVVIGCGADVIARHRRSYEGEDMVFDPLHYANGGAKLDHGSGGMVPSRRSKTLPECQPFPVMGRVGGFTPWSCIARCVWRAGTG